MGIRADWSAGNLAKRVATENLAPERNALDGMVKQLLKGVAACQDVRQMNAIQQHHRQLLALGKSHGCAADSQGEWNYRFAHS